MSFTLSTLSMVGVCLLGVMVYFMFWHVVLLLCFCRLFFVAFGGMFHFGRLRSHLAGLVHLGGFSPFGRVWSIWAGSVHFGRSVLQIHCTSEFNRHRQPTQDNIKILVLRGSFFIPDTVK
jgi:hypothetical protein